MNNEDLMDELDVEAILELQDKALALVNRLREVEPSLQSDTASHDTNGGGRRDFRRWPKPESINMEFHDGQRWHPAYCKDVGIGGARLYVLPEWIKGPVPVRLKAKGEHGVIGLADVMWKNPQIGIAGVRFEFMDQEERDQWAATLIDGLLAGYALD